MALKKNWMVLSIVYCIYTALVAIFTFYSQYAHNLSIMTVQKPNADAILNNVLITLIIGSIVINGLFLWALYACAYRKPGTRFLTFVIYFFGVVIAFNILFLISRHMTMTFVEWTSLLFSYGLFIVWYIMTIKVRNINYDMKK
jgi:hypothetical protein